MTRPTGPTPLQRFIEWGSRNVGKTPEQRGPGRLRGEPEPKRRQRAAEAEAARRAAITAMVPGRVATPEELASIPQMTPVPGAMRHREVRPDASRVAPGQGISATAAESPAPATHPPEWFERLAEGEENRARHLRTIGRHDEADEVERKAANTRAYAETQRDLTKFGNRAASWFATSVTGSDPFAPEKALEREVLSDPEAYVITPREQEELGVVAPSDIGRPRGDWIEEMGAAALGTAPLVLAEGAAVRGIAGLIAASSRAPRAAAAAQRFLRTQQVDPTTSFLARTRTRAQRGAWEGNIAVPFVSGRMEQQSGGSFMEGYILDAVAGTALGPLAEIGFGSVADLARMGARSVRRSVEPARAAAGKTPIADKTPEAQARVTAEEAQRGIAGLLSQLLEQRRAEMGDPLEAARQIGAGARAAAPEPAILPPEPGTVVGERVYPPEPDARGTRSQLEAGQVRLADEFDAVRQMDRQAAEQQAIEAELAQQAELEAQQRALDEAVARSPREKFIAGSQRIIAPAVLAMLGAQAEDEETKMLGLGAAAALSTGRIAQFDFSPTGVRRSIKAAEGVDLHYRVAKNGAVELESLPERAGLEQSRATLAQLMMDAEDAAVPIEGYVTGFEQAQFFEQAGFDLSPRARETGYGSIRYAPHETKRRYTPARGVTLDDWPTPPREWSINWEAVGRALGGADRALRLIDTSKPERPLMAASAAPSGDVEPGPVHAETTPSLLKRLRGSTHDPREQFVEGFVTSHGRFVDREQVMRLLNDLDRDNEGTIAARTRGKLVAEDLQTGGIGSRELWQAAVIAAAGGAASQTEDEDARAGLGLAAGAALTTGRLVGVVAEGLPSRAVAEQRAPGILAAPVRNRVLYARERIRAWYTEAWPEVAGALGIDPKRVRVREGGGTWERQGNVNLQLELPPGVDVNDIRAVVAATGHGLEQDAVPWSAPNPDGSISAVLVATRRGVDVDEIDRLAAALPDDLTFTETREGLVFSNFSDLPDAEFAERVRAALQQHARNLVEGSDVTVFKQDGELLGDNYGNGEQWKRIAEEAATARGSSTFTPDLLDRAHSRLRGAYAAADEAARKGLRGRGGELAIAAAATGAGLTADEEDRGAIGLAGAVALSTGRLGPVSKTQPFFSRLRRHVEGINFATKRPVSVADWIKRLQAGGDFSRKELEATILPRLREIEQGGKGPDSWQLWTRDADEGGKLVLVAEGGVGSVERWRDDYAAELASGEREIRAAPPRDRLTKADILDLLDEEDLQVEVGRQAEEARELPRENDTSGSETLDRERERADSDWQEAQAGWYKWMRESEDTLLGLRDGSYLDQNAKHTLDEIEEIARGVAELRDSNVPGADPYRAVRNEIDARSDALGIPEDADETLIHQLANEIWQAGEWRAKRDMASGELEFLRDADPRAYDDYRDPTRSTLGPNPLLPEAEEGVSYGDAQRHPGGERYREIFPTWLDTQGQRYHYYFDPRSIGHARVAEHDYYPTLPSGRERSAAIRNIEKIAKRQGEIVARIEEIQSEYNIRGEDDLYNLPDEVRSEADNLREEWRDLNERAQRLSEDYVKLQRNAAKAKGVEGEKVYLAEELQTPWPQAAREAGIRREIARTPEQKAADQARFARLADLAHRAQTDEDGSYDHWSRLSTKVETYRGRARHAVERADEWLRMEGIPDALPEGTGQRELWLREARQHLYYPERGKPEGMPDEMWESVETWQGAFMKAEGEASEAAAHYRHLRERRVAIGNALNQAQEAAQGIENPYGVPTSPWIETEDALIPVIGATLHEAAEGGFGSYAWSTAGSRVTFTGATSARTAKKLDIIYDKTTPKIVVRTLRRLGFEVKPERIKLAGADVWRIVLTPEMRETIKKMGVPLLSMLGMLALPDEAQAQDGKDSGATSSAILGFVAMGALAGVGAKFRRPVYRMLKRLGHANPEAAVGWAEKVGASGRVTNPADVNADDYINFSKLTLTPEGETRLRAEVQRVVAAEGIHPKRRISWDEQRAAANELGVTDVLNAGERLTEAEALAARNIISQNTENIGAALAEQERIRTAPIPDEERARELARLQDVIDAVTYENDRLISRFTQARTHAGRLLNSYKIIANKTLDPATWLAAAKRAAGEMPLPANAQAEIARLIAAGDRAGLASFVASLHKKLTWRDPEFYPILRKAGFLLNVPTHLRNFTSNLTFGITEGVKDIPAVMVDKIASLATGVRTKDFDAAAMWNASREGARKGVREMRQAMKGKVDLAQMRKLNLPGETRFANRYLDAYTQLSFRLMSATDKPFKWAAIQRSVDEQARVLARAEGFEGELIRARADEIVAAVFTRMEAPEPNVRGPIDEIILRAISDGEQAVFQNKSVAGRIGSGLKRGAESAHPIAGAVADWFVPFTNTPGAIAGKVAEYSPLGLVLGTPHDVLKLYRAVAKDADPAAIFDLQKRLSERAGRSAVGTTLALLVGWQLAQRGLMTGQTPDTETEKDQQQLEGRISDAVKVGDRWLRVTGISPLGNLIAFGAQLFHHTNDPNLPTATERATASITGMGKTFSEQTFVRGAEEAIDMVKEPKRAGSAFSRSVASAVPSAVAGLARAADPVIRERPRNVGEAVRARIPGASRTLRPQVNQLGDDIRQPGGPVERAVRSQLDIFSSRKDARDDRIIGEMSAVGAEISRLDRRKGESADEFVERQRRVGRAARTTLDRIIDSERYQQADRDAKRQMIEDAVTRIRRRDTRQKGRR